jgi:hypothetical protein
MGRVVSGETRIQTLIKLKAKARAAAAKHRRSRFILAIAVERFGKCPNPLVLGDPLCVCIKSYVRTCKGKVEVYDLDCWNKAEIEYALMVVKNLGYNPKW